MIHHITSKVKQFSPKALLATGKEKTIITNFAEKFGLVYFGYVSQQDDDHRLIRGLTLSNQHQDKHYCIGSHEGYDITFVERNDVLHSPRKNTSRTHRWHIIAIDISVPQDTPHFFVGSHSHSESFYMQLFTKFSSLRSLSLGNSDIYQKEFLAKYRVYGAPAKVLEIEHMLTPIAAEMMTKHFGNLAIEVAEGVLYIYAENTRLSLPLLEAMIKNGIWLARHIEDTSNEALE
jgi:hypothetical protein